MSIKQYQFINNRLVSIPSFLSALHQHQLTRTKSSMSLHTPHKNQKTKINIPSPYNHKNYKSSSQTKKKHEDKIDKEPDRQYINLKAEGRISNRRQQRVQTARQTKGEIFETQKQFVRSARKRIQPENQHLHLIYASQRRNVILDKLQGAKDSVKEAESEQRRNKAVSHIIISEAGKVRFIKN